MKLSTVGKIVLAIAILFSLVTIAAAIGIVHNVAGGDLELKFGETELSISHGQLLGTFLIGLVSSGVLYTAAFNV